MVTSGCASAILEAAEKRRQSLGLKTVGRGPSAADRSEKQSVNIARAREESANAIQEIVENAEAIIDGECELTADDIENSHNQFRINTEDTHRAGKKRKQNRKVSKLRKEGT